MKLLRVCVMSFTVGGALAGESSAGTVVGKLELPEPPERPAMTVKGFLDRVENPLAEVRKVAVTPHMIVVLEGDAAKVESPGQVSWDLVGESFARPVVGAPVGAEIVIKNVSKTSRTLVAREDAKLIPSGPINPTGPKSFRPTEPNIYTIGDKDAPHLRGTLVVVTTKHIATVDAAGKFELLDVPEGSYKLRVFYKDGWIERTDDTVNVGAKGKTDVSVKVPVGYPRVGAPKK
ncbi:MAG: hypothetical protein H0X17_23075 [Deltaproteobacteria bacterium]|nr:hypothetical protein [Deltaproteobacteria bacterium]